MNLGIAGIHTNIGKTICSAVLVEALGFDYWKPVQAGSLDETDSMWVKQHISNTQSIIFPERHLLKLAASPHWAAEKENIEIKAEDFVLPESKNGLVVETAGGLMTPLSKTFLNIDLVKQLKLNVLLVSNTYLGSINHTLLTCQVLKQAGVNKVGIVFCGEKVTHATEFILDYSGFPVVLHIPTLKLDRESVTEFAKEQKTTIKENLDELFG